MPSKQCSVLLIELRAAVLSCWDLLKYSHASKMKEKSTSIFWGEVVGLAAFKLPFGWTYHTKSSHTGHGSIVKSFTQKEDLCYTEVSNSSSALLVTWHSQRAVRIAWYCRPESKEKILPWNQHGQAQFKTLPGPRKLCSCSSWQQPCSGNAFPFCDLGLRAQPGSAQHWPVLWPWVGVRHTKHRVFSWAWCPAQLYWAGHWVGACAQPSKPLPDPGCANVLLANVLHKSKRNGRFWTNKQTALREHFLPEIAV